MAIWQFQFNLIPSNGIKNITGAIPLYLSAYAKVDTNDFDENEDFPNYWSGLNPLNYTDKFKKFLGKARKNWGDGVILGNNESTCVEIWEDDLTVSMDVRDFNHEFFKYVIEFAKSENLYVVVGDKGKLLAPSYKSMLQEVEASKALRFCLDPKNTLLDHAIKTDS